MCGLTDPRKYRHVMICEVNRREEHSHSDRRRLATVRLIDEEVGGVGLQQRSYGVTVSTGDFKSLGLGSTPSMTLPFALHPAKHALPSTETTFNAVRNYLS